MSTAPAFRRTARDIVGKGGRKSFPAGRKSSLDVKGHRSHESAETQSEAAEQPREGPSTREALDREDRTTRAWSSRKQMLAKPWEKSKEALCWPSLVLRCSLREGFSVFGSLFCFGLTEKDVVNRCDFLPETQVD